MCRPTAYRLEKKLIFALHVCLYLVYDVHNKYICQYIVTDVEFIIAREGKKSRLSLFVLL